VVGWGARATVPPRLRPPAYRAFARATGADLAEAELPLASYPSFGELFVRRLRAGARPIDPDPATITAPCDGALAAVGTVARGTLVQAKGRSYSLAELLADRELADVLDGGSYATIYLAPRDYHRVHSPAAARVVSHEFVPGALWPVNPRLAGRRDRLLARNERVVIRLDGGPLGTFVVVMVGAAGVGNITLSHDGIDRSAPPFGGTDGQAQVPAFESARLRTAGERRRFEVDAPVARGGELGMFRLGSTVVVAFERGAVALVGAPGDRLRFGAALGGTRRIAGIGVVA
jgi:phosphatidylserine decarboxylase